MRVLAAFSVACLFSPAAAAQSKEWYGWQILITDGVALALAAPGAIRLATDPNFANREFEGLAATGLVVGGLLAAAGAPAIHASHGHVGRAVGSAAARVLFPLAVAAVTGLAGFSCEDSAARCHDQASMESARWVIATVLLVQLGDIANAWDDRLAVAPDFGRNAVWLMYRY